jgi:hypothetical protein
MQQPLYKYLPKRYLKAFLDRGSLKIGTLYEYRQTDAYGEDIGDKDEGLHKTELCLPGGGEIELGSNTPEAEFFRKHVLRTDQQSSKVKIILKDEARVVVQSHSQDLYIYCMTAEYSASVMKKGGYDACLEIVRPSEFFQTISRKIRHKAEFNGLCAIKYMDKTTHYTRPHEKSPSGHEGHQVRVPERVASDLDSQEGS